MAEGLTFMRHEMKYLISESEKQILLTGMKEHMALDRYGRSLIRNVYYDTKTYRLIRRSLEKPVYKEKLRVRSYSSVGPDDTVFVELKKKYDSIVYKRRIPLVEKDAEYCLKHEDRIPSNNQIAKEIQYFCSYYGDLHPVVYLSYEREAYYALDGSDFRVTLDENILYRNRDLSLESEPYGIPLLEKGQTLLEIKTTGGIPLWFTKILSENHIYQTSFSKYGLAYRNMIEA